MIRHLTSRARLAAALFAAALLAQGCAGGGEALSLQTVGNRADLISGGQALVRVHLPKAASPDDARLSLNGNALDGALQPAPDGDGYLVLVSGLSDGKNQLVARAGGKAMALDITNHPNGGPVFSGPQIQPWTCREGATDALCDRETEISWVYLPAGGEDFAPYDPAAPAADAAKVTTSTGAEVPFVVRIERFNQDRSGVAVATVFDPSAPWTPYTPQKQWNGGVFVLQGAGCGTSYFDHPAGDPLDRRALSQGFAVVTVALLHNTINCNPVVQAEAAMMAKEHVAETYGPFNLVFGMGSSGGAISQLMDQNAYPGLYDGLIINHVFADSDASRMNAYDCARVYASIEASGLEWSEDARSAVAGMLSGCDAHVKTTRYLVYDPGVGTGCDVPDDAKFNEEKNPGGVRCTLQDYERNQIGVDADGRAFGRIDTEGVQYGLLALKSGAITAEQFVALNAGIGGHDANFKPTTGRTVAPAEGLPRLYETGVDNTATNYADTAILETRIWATDFHQPVHTDMLRARILRAQGKADNHVVWRFDERGDPAYDQAFDTMVAWLRAIKADDRKIPLSRKVADDRPAAAHDRCFPKGGAEADLGACAARPQLVRQLAGAPMTNDLGKCQLKPLDRSAYGDAVFTDEQWARLQAVFPTGVCDWEKPLVGYTKTTPWLTYSGPGQYQPLGPAPTAYAVEAD